MESSDKRELKYMVREEVREALRDLLPDMLRKAIRDNADREIVDPIVAKIERSLK